MEKDGKTPRKAKKEGASGTKVQAPPAVHESRQAVQIYRHKDVAGGMEEIDENKEEKRIQSTEKCAP